MMFIVFCCSQVYSFFEAVEAVLCGVAVSSHNDLPTCHKVDAGEGEAMHHMCWEYRSMELNGVYVRVGSTIA
jgi:hypothetical protein